MHSLWLSSTSIHMQSVSSDEPSNKPDLLLRVNVPLLAENAPEGWSVVLVDNPGFGEAKQHIAQITSESWESSAAYVYLTTPETKGLIAEVDLFKAFHSKGQWVRNISSDNK